MTEPENTADDNSIWGVVGDVLEDVMEQSFTINGSMIVLAICVWLFCRYAPYLYQLAMAWVTRHNKTGD